MICTYFFISFAVYGRAVETILHHCPEHVNVRDGIGCTPLHLAATEGEIAVAKVILENVS